MKKPQIRYIVPHLVPYAHARPLSERITELHIQAIQNQLNRMELTAGQKLQVIDRMIANIKSGRGEGALKNRIGE